MNNKALLLESFYEQLASHPGKVYMTQPVAHGQVVEYTWAEAARFRASLPGRSGHAAIAVGPKRPIFSAPPAEKEKSCA